MGMEEERETPSRPLQSSLKPRLSTSSLSLPLILKVKAKQMGWRNSLSFNRRSRVLNKRCGNKNWDHNTFNLPQYIFCRSNSIKLTWLSRACQSKPPAITYKGILMNTTWYNKLKFNVWKHIKISQNIDLIRKYDKIQTSLWKCWVHWYMWC